MFASLFFARDPGNTGTQNLVFRENAQHTLEGWDGFVPVLQDQGALIECVSVEVPTGSHRILVQKRAKSPGPGNRLWRASSWPRFLCEELGGGRASRVPRNRVCSRGLRCQCAQRRPHR